MRKRAMARRRLGGVGRLGALVVCGLLALDGGCIQAPTFPTINPQQPHGMRAPGGDQASAVVVAAPYQARMGYTRWSVQMRCARR